MPDLHWTPHLVKVCLVALGTVLVAAVLWALPQTRPSNRVFRRVSVVLWIHVCSVGIAN